MRWVKAKLLPNLSQTVLSWLVTPLITIRFGEMSSVFIENNRYGKVVEAYNNIGQVPRHV
jgi:hypothetical protein